MRQFAEWFLVIVAVGAAVWFFYRSIRRKDCGDCELRDNCTKIKGVRGRRNGNDGRSKPGRGC